MTQKIQKIPKTIGFIGAGNMAGALIKGMLAKGVIAPEHILASDISPQRLTVLRKETRINIFARNISVLEGSDIIVLSVKPQHVETVLDEISNQTSGKVIVSIVTGLGSDSIQSVLGSDTAIVRVMPNTPALVGEAMSSLSFSQNVGGKDRTIIRGMFEAVGQVIEIDEKHMDAITALSGSGPAYIFQFAEELIRAGKAAGLEDEVARDLVVQTIIGAGKMLKESGQSAEELRMHVTSPGGTTEAGLQVMRQHGFSEMIQAVVQKAVERSRELSELSHNNSSES